MDPKIAARMIAVLALGAAMTAAFMALRGNGSQDASSPRSARPGGEPAAIELARCRDIGMAAIDDEACRKMWAKNRRRFLGSSRPATPYVAPSIENDQSRPLPSGAKNQSHPGTLTP
ncbi:putative entry exclusion protein TrbK-alt [Mesorhizobium sp.]|uniref:putative entry exclusion protein TrbK-alt n=1 Tax=Mesorhizobium sp. TaxID=1871066 RepID=UPI0012084A62|nr:putative entry exclusion protein TrbK-alt [Mesorhizobium sp.]TIO07776.1 MAG: conjugal transfer protein TrbK [Mesorhizobium sp.]TIO30947.1 MAG: conjugal transfer protein TrbK [Mesorhizobium sp.]TIP08725.1 MAG: conjugal transfer protein TrbK [Mesorhizobium sp.]